MINVRPPKILRIRISALLVENLNKTDLFPHRDEIGSPTMFTILEKIDCGDEVELVIQRIGTIDTASGEVVIDDLDDEHPHLH